MKISHAIIRNGIIKGILEGTKVPEKPTRQWGLNTPRQERGIIVGMWTKYNNRLQALWDSSVEWEDQTRIIKLVQEESFKSQGEIKRSNIVDGIYPLEGVNARGQWQRLIPKELSDIGEYWADVEKETLDSHSSFKHREVLRLIPQPDSEQKKKASKEEYQSKTGCDENTCQRDGCKLGTCVGYECYVGVEGTEVSEPTCGDCGRKLTLVRPGKYQCDNPHCDGGVSEGEPTQDQAILNQINLFSEAAIIQEKQGILAVLRQFHIQKLKP